MSMHNISRSAALILLPLMAATCTIEATEDDRTAPEPHDGGSLPISAPDMLGYLEAKVDIADNKFMQLAEAVPEELYDWQPMEGVRSFREIFVHIAADNWYGGALLGTATPDDISVSSDGASTGPYQEVVLSKAETLVHLRRSFDFLATVLDATRDQLGNGTTLGGNEITYGDLWVRLITHMHEHLGQTIAYARANEIVPPWSH
jgi:uncharacterized damage-inducible protein DinB